MSKPRLIKKYPNRRLYDTGESRYITLHDIAGLLMQESDVLVLEQPSGRDITHSVLLQTVIELEASALARLSIHFLTSLIRSYATANAGGTALHLERALETYLATAARPATHVSGPVRGDAPQHAATS